MANRNRLDSIKSVREVGLMARVGNWGERLQAARVTVTLNKWGGTAVPSLTLCTLTVNLTLLVHQEFSVPVRSLTFLLLFGVSLLSIFTVHTVERDGCFQWNIQSTDFRLLAGVNATLEVHTFLSSRELADWMQNFSKSGKIYPTKRIKKSFQVLPVQRHGCRRDTREVWQALSDTWQKLWSDDEFGRTDCYMFINLIFSTVLSSCILQQITKH